MSSLPLPPDTYREFVQRYPKIAEGWEVIASAGKEGPLGEKTARLIKLAVACAALREGAVHANVRKALALGITREEIEQVIALTAGTPDSLVVMRTSMAHFTLNARERDTYRRYAGLALPRHTSYPIAPVWRAAYGPDDFRADLRQS